MKRSLLTLAFFSLVFPGSALCQSRSAVSDMPYSGAPCTASGGIKPSDLQITSFNRFDAALRSAIGRQDAAALAFLVHFPLRVNTTKGSLLIPDAYSLSGHLAEIFPSKVREQVLSTVAEDFICRYDEGLGYKAGVIWVSTDGRKFTVDSVNAVDTQARSKEPALAYTCETKTHRITIEEHGAGSYRYRSWNKPKELTQIPDVDLLNGEHHFEGTGVCSYALYSFSKGNVVYQVSSGMGCGDGSEPKNSTGNLTVTIGGKQVTQAWCF